MRNGANPEVSLLCVNYRSARNLHDLHDSIAEELLDAGWEFIVADNDASSGDLRSTWSPNYPVRIVKCPSNLGFAAGVNMAAKEAAGKYLIMINPDVSIEFKALEQLVRVAEDIGAKLGCLGGRAVKTDGSPAPCFGEFPTPIQVVRAFHPVPFIRGDSADRQTLKITDGLCGEDKIEVDYPTGALLLTPSELFESLNGLDERYFLYFEEVDYAMRCRQEGKRNYVATGTGYTHAGGQSFSQEPVGAQFDYWVSSLHEYLGKHYGRKHADRAIRGIMSSARFRSNLLTLANDSIKRERWSAVYASCRKILIRKQD
jgi:GT2 family glycosyltransferase